jgi:hypothetical protein
MSIYPYLLPCLKVYPHLTHVLTTLMPITLTPTTLTPIALTPTTLTPTALTPTALTPTTLPLFLLLEATSRREALTSCQVTHLPYAESLTHSITLTIAPRKVLETTIVFK